MSPCGKRKKNKSQPDYALLYTTFKKFLQKRVRILHTFCISA
ncbi:hypothetical protein HMPREF9442_01390 [Paraprevotella xylaniphila YIT 11841]|uniref:Uncharacterized protein n=1 Tax=Paraprevotella xylaniphila YIT 11841 TaxID=762982 RepID=F3QT73_9BACT|nr:hypothetical protein HMPREF9442_01390 [Paraprevotella xylaniphila YIT 11841]